MKYSIFIIIIFTLNSFLFGQYIEKEKNLVSRQKPGIGWFYSGFKPYEKEKLRKYDRFIIDIAYNDWQGDRTVFDSPWNSLGVNFSLFFDQIISKKNTFSIGYGLGFSHFNNRSELIYERDLDENSTTVSSPDASVELQSKKFTANYIEVPLELRFRTKGRKHFKFLMGGKIGYQLNSFTQRISETNDGEIKTRNYTFGDNNRLRYGVTARIGIRNFALYGAYHFSPLFTNSESTALYPIEIGLSISLF